MKMVLKGDYKRVLQIWSRSYSTNMDFTIEEWLNAREAYRVDPDFRTYVQQKTRSK